MVENMEEKQVQWKSLQDYPINEEGKDELGFSKYVKALTSFVTECETPMTIAIQGEWGSGKSSLMELMKEQLLSKDKPKLEAPEVQIVHINVWEYAQLGSDKNLPLAFLGGIIDQILQKPQENVMLNNLKKAALLVGKYTAIGIDSVIGNRAGDSFDRMVESIFGKKVQIPTVSELKIQFADVVSKSSKRVVFFIDDLDRLQPSKAVELMEVLKNFLDCKNCIFVLAVDYDVVKDGVREKYPELDEKKVEKFFDKIIQVPFIVPCAEKKDYIQEMCEKSLIFKGIDLNSEEEKLVHVFIGEATRNNPREIKRLINILTIQKLVNDNENDNVGKTNKKEKIIQLTALLGIQIYSQNLYKIVLDNSLCELEQIEVAKDDINVWHSFLKLIKCAKEESWGDMVNASKITNRQTTQKKKHNVYFANIISGNQEEAVPWRFTFGNQSINGLDGLLAAIFHAVLTKRMNGNDSCKDETEFIMDIIKEEMLEYCRTESVDSDNMCAICIKNESFLFKFRNKWTKSQEYDRCIRDMIQTFNIEEYISISQEEVKQNIKIKKDWGEQHLK